MRPICLPFGTLLNNNYEGLYAELAGWGKTNPCKISLLPFKTYWILIWSQVFTRFQGTSWYLANSQTANCQFKQVSWTDKSQKDALRKSVVRWWRVGQGHVCWWQWWSHDDTRIDRRFSTQVLRDRHYLVWRGCLRPDKKARHLHQSLRVPWLDLGSNFALDRSFDYEI